MNKKEAKQVSPHYNFFSKNHRGLSTVVTTLILIVLVLVAVGVIWVVVSNIISEETENIDLGRFKVKMTIEQVTFKDDGTLDVRVKREVGEGEISKVKFVIGDGTDSLVIKKDTTLEELEKHTFNLEYDGIVKEISVVPVLVSASGKESLGNPTKKEFSDKDMIKNLGGVSWWRLDDDADDEVGGNHGSPQGGVDFVEDSERGKVASFDGVDDYIDVNDDLTLQITNELTVETWVKFDLIDNTYDGLVFKRGTDSTNFTSFALRRYRSGYSIGEIAFETVSITNGERAARGSFTPQENIWYYIVGVYDGSNMKLYIDGKLEDTVVQSGSLIDTTGQPLYISQNYRGNGFLNGTIDNVIIFNKALTEHQIEELYNYNFG